MAEDHSHHHEFDDLDGLKPQEIASMRWQAVEGLICFPGLSSTARRVCILLITTMDNKTRRSFRGERRIAAELGVHLSAVKKAKAELKDAEMITWFNPGGPRHLSHYNFNWEALTRHSREAKQRGDAVVAETVSQRRQGTRTGTYQPRSNSTPQAIQLGIEYDPAPPYDSGHPDKASVAAVELMVKRNELAHAKIEQSLQNLTIPDKA